MLFYGRNAQTKTADLPQAPVPNIAKLPGGVVVERATPGALPLSLDDAIDRGEKHNLQLLLVMQNERMVRGEVLTVKNNLLPSLTAKGRLEAQQIDLAALGFRPGSLAEFGIAPRDISDDCEGQYGFGADQHEPAAVQCAGLLSVPVGAEGRLRRQIIRR